MVSVEQIAADLADRYEDVSVSQFRGQTRLLAPRGRLLEILSLLRNHYGLDFLTDITCVDYLDYRGAKNRFGLVYVLSSSEGGETLIVRVMLDEPDLAVPSATPLWEGANWLEREVYDMFGMRFEGHPDLRRILLPDEFTAYPLRKDYPLQGRGERHNFPVIQRDKS